MLRWVASNTYISGSGSTLVVQGFDSTSVTPGITNYAENMDLRLVFLNALAGDHADRTELYNDDQDTLVNEVVDNCENTIVVINTVCARLMDQWIEHDNVTAVPYGSLLGQESGNSIVDVLYGDVKFELRRRDISYWDVKAQKWAVAPGTYTIYVGASSRDLRLHGTFIVQTKA
jgi:beta-glucosidase